MTEIQVMTLRDVFRQAGLSEGKIEDIFLLLYFKPPNVQQAFYYVSIGKTQKETGEIIGVSQMQVSKYLSNNCTDIQEYLKLKSI